MLLPINIGKIYYPPAGSEIYVSGKVSGVVGGNINAFRKYEQIINGVGFKYIPVIPHDCIDPYKPISWFDATRHVLRRMLDPNIKAVMVMDGYSDSRGAVLEVGVAYYLGIPTINSDWKLISSQGAIDFMYKQVLIFDHPNYEELSVEIANASR